MLRTICTRKPFNWELKLAENKRRIKIPLSAALIVQR